ncbi:ribosomal-protein-alanine N-acetyltransferase [Maioricimonas rarisocia]|uniref:Ribosomal-protein-alanine N-acetyltransferase n=2 Tax=Maioricimonas rarisocia TaxID=2528026 RepID=A0A517Z660_9PLAN|nr:ribosomal-protein-alanine N-acetyltransferase [Maioricimonas rarisocia]
MVVITETHELTLDRQRIDSEECPPCAGTPAMPTTYFKRYRMEFDLQREEIASPQLPDGYCWASWSPALVESHAIAKFESFQGEVDTQVFPCLANLAGCRKLMRDIASHSGFLPRATWLIRFDGNEFAGQRPCATIQGLFHSPWLGAVQNVGVVAEHRGLGLGRALLNKSLAGFRASGLQRVYLEVTAANTPAVDLYLSVGFRLTRTSYRAIEPMEPAGT